MGDDIDTVAPFQSLQCDIEMFIIYTPEQRFMAGIILRPFECRVFFNQLVQGRR